MKWFDGLRDWYQDGTNRLVTNCLCGATAVATLILGSLLYWGGSAIYTAVADNPLEGCFAKDGRVVVGASETCFVPKPYTAATTAVKRATVKPVYDPPCAAGSDEHACNDRIYGKRLLEGTIDTVKFNGDELTVTGNEDSADRHLQPDYTEVTLVAVADDQEAESIKVCGNQLEHFNPGQQVKRVIKESTLADYDGCYTLYMNVLTFGGRNVAPVYSKPLVPGKK